jgi:hypothetical protein
VEQGTRNARAEYSAQLGRRSHEDQGNQLVTFGTGACHHNGNLNLATDLLALGALFDVHWKLVANKTAIERAQVERALQLGTELLVAGRQGSQRQPRDSRGDWSAQPRLHLAGQRLRRRPPRSVSAGRCIGSLTDATVAMLRDAPDSQQGLDS